MASICFLTYFQINFKYTRVPILYTIWCSVGTVMVRLFEASLYRRWTCDKMTFSLAFSMALLPAMASDHSSMTYKLIN